MHGTLPRVVLLNSLVAVSALLPLATLAGPQIPDTPQLGARDAGNEALYRQADLDVYIKAPDGAPLKGQVVVTLTTLAGKFYSQMIAKDGVARFNGVPPTEYTVLVVAPAYLRASKNIDMQGRTLYKVTVDVQPIGDSEDAAASIGISALPPKVQRDLGKALEALRANKPGGALSHLEAARRGAPKSAEIEYLFGVYSSQINDQVHAKAYWLKTLELDPKHLSALLAVGYDYLHENKPGEAAPYLSRAVDADPSSWRAHALLAESLVLQGQQDEAMKQAQRAIELGHDRASSAQLVVVRVLVEKGDQERAIHTLEVYVQAHPADKESAKYLERLKNPQPGDVSGSAATGALAAVGAGADALPVPSNWLPPDVDEKVPPVEPGASCSVDDVVHKAGERLMELVTDVDRFTATESLLHESIDKYGLPSSPEKRKFNYVVSIQEVQRGYLNVEEYRNSNGLPAEFPAGVATNGLPALVLIFHPYNAPNFEMACEGLARWTGGLAWQVHFKQRPDKPNNIKRYRIGADGPSYPVSLKGRAWISADTFQIVRLETDLVAPLPQIRLVADHTAIEYGPVKFRNGQVNMWLPQTAEVFYDWKGRRIHRRHSFSNYLLFAVEDKQKITVPKVEDVSTDGGPSGERKEKP